jgi:hypothetical protein
MSIRDFISIDIFVVSLLDVSEEAFYASAWVRDHKNCLFKLQSWGNATKKVT